MDINKIAKLVGLFTKKAAGVGTEQFTMEDVKRILFEAGLFPVKSMPKLGAHAEFDINAPVLNDYVWPAIDAAAAGKPVTITMNVAPRGIISLTSDNPKVASHPSIKQLAQKLTDALGGVGPSVAMSEVFASGLQ